MKFSLTAVYITSRYFPKIRWFFDSLRHQLERDDQVSIIVVDLWADEPGRRERFRKIGGNIFSHVTPKPTVWQGKHRLTQDNWWGVSNTKNTGICLCRTEWIVFIDDRSVLMPGWMDCIKSAMDGNYLVAGAYEKFHNCVVENGILKSFDTPINGDGHPSGKDAREKYVADHRGGAAPTPCPGEWTFGCNTALPLDWALEVNGFDESCDGMGMEDNIFGLQLTNRGHPTQYDYRMKISEDRTPGQCGPDIVRRDKGISPNDRSHALLEKLKVHDCAQHQWNIRALRTSILNGGSWPIPTSPDRDFWDGQMLKDM